MSKVKKLTELNKVGASMDLGVVKCGKKDYTVSLAAVDKEPAVKVDVGTKTVLFTFVIKAADGSASASPSLLGTKFLCKGSALSVYSKGQNDGEVFTIGATDGFIASLFLGKKVKGDEVFSNFKAFLDDSLIETIRSTAVGSTTSVKLKSGKTEYAVKFLAQSDAEFSVAPKLQVGKDGKTIFVTIGKSELGKQSPESILKIFEDKDLKVLKGKKLELVGKGEGNFSLEDSFKGGLEKAIGDGIALVEHLSAEMKAKVKAAKAKVKAAEAEAAKADEAVNDAKGEAAKDEAAKAKAAKDEAAKAAKAEAVEAELEAAKAELEAAKDELEVVKAEAAKVKAALGAAVQAAVKAKAEAAVKAKAVEESSVKIADTLEALKNIKVGKTVPVAKFKVEETAYSIEYKASEYDAGAALDGHKIVITYPTSHMHSSAKAIEEYIAYAARFTVNGNAIKDVGNYKGSSTLKCELEKDISCVVEKADEMPIEFFPNPLSPSVNWEGNHITSDL